MPDMQIPVLIQIGAEEREIVARVRYRYTPGLPAHYGSPTYPGHPAQGPEVDISDVSILTAQRDRLGDYEALPAGKVRDAIEDMAAAYIVEHYEDDDAPDPSDIRKARMEQDDLFAEG